MIKYVSIQRVPSTVPAILATSSLKMASTVQVCTCCKYGSRNPLDNFYSNYNSMQQQIWWSINKKHALLMESNHIFYQRFFL